MDVHIAGQALCCLLAFRHSNHMLWLQLGRAEAYSSFYTLLHVLEYLAGALLTVEQLQDSALAIPSCTLQR